MQISQTVFEYSFVEVDDAFEAEDKNEDGFLSRPELGRGLKTLGIKLQTEEVKRVFGLVDPAGTKQVDYNQFGGELYRRIGEMRGVERERLEEDTAARRKRLGRGVTVRVPGVGEATGLPDGVRKILKNALRELKPGDNYDYSRQAVSAAFQKQEVEAGQIEFEGYTEALRRLGLPLGLGQRQQLFSAIDREGTGEIEYGMLAEEIERSARHAKQRAEAKAAQEAAEAAAREAAVAAARELLHELLEQHSTEDKTIRKLEKFLSQTDAKLASLMREKEGVEPGEEELQRWGEEGPEPRNLALLRSSSKEFKDQLESLRAAQEEATRMLDALLSTHKRTTTRLEAVREQAGVEEGEELAAFAAKRRPTHTPALAAKQAAEIFDSLEVDEQGRVPVEALRAALLEQSGEWAPSAQAWAEQLRKESSRKAKAAATGDGAAATEAGDGAGAMLLSRQDFVELAAVRPTPPAAGAEAAAVKRSSSWPGAADVPSERPLPLEQLELDGLEDSGRADSAAESAQPPPTPESSTKGPRRRRIFRLTVQVNPLVDEEEEIEVEASHIAELHREVHTALGLPEGLDIRLTEPVDAAAPPPAPEGGAEDYSGMASPMPLRSLRELQSPAKIQVWMRDAVIDDDEEPDPEEEAAEAAEAEA